MLITVGQNEYSICKDVLFSDWPFRPHANSPTVNLVPLNVFLALCIAYAHHGFEKVSLVKC